MILLNLRLSVMRDKIRILKTLTKLHVFGNRRENAFQSPLKKYSTLACRACILFPISMVAGIIIELIINFDKYLTKFHLDVHNITSITKAFYGSLLALYAIAFAIHYFVFPAMVMILLSFMYMLFVISFQRQLEATRFKLLRNFSKEEVSRTLIAFSEAKKIHRDLEETISFKTFLAYILTFGSILQVVCFFTTDYLPDAKTLQILFSFTIIFWTIGWFVFLTMCGTQVEKIEVFVKDMRQDVMSKNFGKNPDDAHNELACLNLFNAFSALELRFTGWGMFEVDKKLFFTISGILVTYGVLLATELTKMEK
ncbi:uncharacterized protein NPIL_395481 [Nephila pilipes]|uniref:Gustatory receptor n=1 Tax=Nephila pilipes TaxID=299642 RepID=A0A8X6KL41_NEPPI|nr:uncharacterized protein NPIL_395481 [Nephila pilipes]